jgi:hypothetical protein
VTHVTSTRFSWYTRVVGTWRAGNCKGAWSLVLLLSHLEVHDGGQTLRIAMETREIRLGLQTIQNPNE